jgi:hypothetical protein
MKIEDMYVGQRVIFICPENSSSSFCRRHDRWHGTVNIVVNCYARFGLINVEFDDGSDSHCYPYELQPSP